MKRVLSIGILVLSFSHTAGQSHPDPVTLAIGSKAPDFNLPSTEGKFYRLSDFSSKQVLAVIFSCNHCPTAQAYEDRIIALANDYSSKNVAIVVISPNDPNAINLGELGYTELSDSFEEMKIRYKQKGYNFPYLYDGENQKLSLQYGPVATPHAFVFDKDRILRYTGRLDKNEKPGTGQGEDIRKAIDAILAGKQVSDPVTKTFGCSIKWSWKNEYNARLAKEWSGRPVTLKPLDLNATEELIRNQKSGKLRLVNIWATWCGPCVQEMPEFITIDRMYRERDFEFITVSLDNPDKQDKVLDRLKKLEASNLNFIFTGSDKYAFMEKIDPNWQGALPYTLLVEPGGKIVYGKQGTIDPLQLKRLIVENRMIGRYY
jgi:thiol-disulfide isomerase/thioredoxin